MLRAFRVRVRVRVRIKTVVCTKEIYFSTVTQLTLRAGRAARGSRDVEARYPFLPVAPFRFLTTFGFVFL
jgi:hypothetical protein